MLERIYGWLDKIAGSKRPSSVKKPCQDWYQEYWDEHQNQLAVKLQHLKSPADIDQKKPRITKMPRSDTWVCTCKYVNGYGATPLGAYLNWVSTRGQLRLSQRLAMNDFQYWNTCR